MEIAAFIISLFTLLFSLYVFFVHDIKLKRQANALGELQIEKFKKEEIESNKAIIEANVIRHEKGKRVIKVYNKGKATAKNVNVTFEDGLNSSILNNPSPIDIKPQNSIEFIFFAHSGMPDKTTIKFEWKDNFNEKNIDTQVVQI